MGTLIIDPGGITKPLPDEVLYEMYELLENLPAGRAGFWITAPLEVDGEGEFSNLYPDLGHQRIWVSASATITLAFDDLRTETRYGFTNEEFTIHL